MCKSGAPCGCGKPGSSLGQILAIGFFAVVVVGGAGTTIAATVTDVIEGILYGIAALTVLGLGTLWAVLARNRGRQHIPVKHMPRYTKLAYRHIQPEVAQPPKRRAIQQRRVEYAVADVTVMRRRGAEVTPAQRIPSPLPPAERQPAKILETRIRPVAAIESRCTCSTPWCEGC